MHIAQGLAHARKVAGNRQAIICGAIRYTWEEFEQRTDALARGLAGLGVQRGDRVAVLMLNCHRYLELYYACARMGAVIVPLNINLARPEIAFILNDSGSTVLVVDTTFASSITGHETFPAVTHMLYIGEQTTPEGMINYEDVVSKGSHMQESVDQAMEDDDLASLSYTDGTTGPAKGVMLSHKNSVSNAMHVVVATGYNERDTYLHAAPMFHLADAGSTFAITMVAARHMFIPFFQAERVLQAVQQERVTVTLLAPGMLNILLNHPDVAAYDFSSIRRLTYGSSPMPLELIRKGLARWGQIFSQGYGLTEAAPLLTGLDTWDHLPEGTPTQQRRLASIGREAQGVEVRVVNSAGEDVQPGEIGEIIARGPNIMQGYWQMPEATSAALVDGWLHTGDLATLDEENYIFLVDRANDMINCAGEHVYSLEVEQALSTHPAVLEVAVIGIPSEQWGQSVHAVVVLKPETQASGEALLEHIARQLAGYKVPRTLEFSADPLPKSAAGRILKRDLRAKYRTLP